MISVKRSIEISIDPWKLIIARFGQSFRLTLQFSTNPLISHETILYKDELEAALNQLGVSLNGVTDDPPEVELTPDPRFQ